MKFKLGQKFIVKGLECEIKFINNDYAWAFPIAEELDYISKHLVMASHARIDANGYDEDGNKVLSIYDNTSIS